MAFKDSLGNSATEIILVVSHPFRPGDYIEIASSAGSAEKIGPLTATLLTLDNQEITVANDAIYADTIINWLARDTRRIDLVIGVSY